MKKLLWVGDAGCPSGFARATHEILDTLRFVYDVTVLGINYRGDPHDYPYPVYAAAVSGREADLFAVAMGVERLIWMCDKVQPDVIVLQNDGWNIPPYLQRLRMKKANGEYAFPEQAALPVVAIVAVDGKNFQGRWLDGVDHAVFWTRFALEEARAGGYKGPASVIPLGVHLDLYSPSDRQAARARFFPEELRDRFVVGNVNRNQPRKRWDLTLKYFAEWVTTKHVRDAWLYLQPAPTGDMGYDVAQLAHYYGIADRVALAKSDTHYGIAESGLAGIYNCLDLNISTTQGEGMGLTTLEAMACGVPCILPDWAAYGDWARQGAWLVPCSTTAVGPPYVNVIGGVPDQGKFVTALHALYTNADGREQNARAALELAQEPRFRWETIGQQYLDVLDGVLYPSIGEDAPHAATEAEWQDLGRAEVADGR